MPVTPPDQLGLTTAHRIWIETQTVTYTSKSNAGDVAAVVDYALRRAISRREVLAMNGFFTSQDVAWNLGAVLLPAGMVCKEGDTITEADGTVWSVLDVQLLSKMFALAVCMSAGAVGKP